MVSNSQDSILCWISHPENSYSIFNSYYASCPFQQGHVHSFSYFVLLWTIAYSTLPIYAFISIEFIEFNRTKFQDIVSHETLYCLSCSILHKNCPMLENWRLQMFVSSWIPMSSLSNHRWWRRNTLPLLIKELSKAPNSQNGRSSTCPLLCAQPLGTSSNAASHRHNAHKMKEVPPWDFHVNLTWSE